MFGMFMPPALPESCAPRRLYWRFVQIFLHFTMVVLSMVYVYQIGVTWMIAAALFATVLSGLLALAIVMRELEFVFNMGRLECLRELSQAHIEEREAMAGYNKRVSRNDR